MKLSSVAVPAALALLAAAEVDHPAFVAFDKSSLSSSSFFEQFDSDDWAQLWKISKAKKDDEFSYVGEWNVEQSSIFPGFDGDKGLVLKTPSAHHAIHAELLNPFNNVNDTLVLQYEVKLQEGLRCGGAYIKLLSQNGLPTEESQFNNDTPYQVMFGPDKCGTTNKVHFIIRRKDQNTGKYEEKHLSLPAVARVTKTTNLYTLIIEPTQDFQIRINGDIVKAGNLLTDGVLSPGLNPPKEIDDPNDVKPEDWDDREVIPDPEQTSKPDDWDEDAPRSIPDPTDIKPESWNEDAEEYIIDPDAEKPEDWDDEEDGEWIAPYILNPECQQHGCGKWEAREIPNPDFKGKWKQPLIENPAYKGEWEPKKIANPDYFEDSTPSDLEPIGGIGFELWSIDSDILFDNIYLGHSIKEAELIGNETFIPKAEIESLAVKESQPNAVEPDIPPKFEGEETDIFDDLVKKVENHIVDAQAYFREFFESPLETLSTRPAEGGIYAGVLVIITTFILLTLTSFLGLFIGGDSASLSQGKTSGEKIEEIKKSTTTTGASKSETKATKRT